MQFVSHARRYTSCMEARPTSAILLPFALFVFCLPGCFSTTAQAQGTAKSAPPKTTAELSELASLSQQIQDLTTSVPPELAAYALLRVVEANAVSQPEQRRQLIEQAYMLAGQSPYPVWQTAVGGISDTRAGYLSRALSLGLDTLTLRTKAVTAMLKIDPERARDLFQQLRPLALANRSCADSMLYDPSAYYRSAGDVYKKGFSQEEQAKGLPEDFLESVFRDVNQASEVGPAADLLRTLQFDTEMLARAEGAFARSLSGIRGDYRSFVSTQGNLIRNVTRLAQVQGRASHALLEATRAYVIANESGAVCGDDSASGVSGSAPSSNIDSFASLNQVVARYGIAPVTAADLKPGSIVAVNDSNAQAYWQSPTAKQLLANVRSLRSGDKDSPQWQENASSALTSLREWIDAASEPSEEDFYIEKAVLYAQMMVLTPSDLPVYEEMLHEYIAFLSEPPPSDDVRVYWLWNIQNLVQRVRMNRTNAESERLKLEAAIQDAPSPSIALYGYLLALDRMQRTAFGRGYSSRS
jgi:hypothetical protein